MTETSKPAAAKPKSEATKPKSAKPVAKTAATKAKPAATKTSAAKTPSAKKTATKAGSKAESGRLRGARAAASVPVGAVFGAANRVGAFVSPVTDRVSGDRKVADLRGQVEGILRQAEKTGGAVLANEKLKVLGDRADKVQTDLTKALESQSARTQQLIGQARGQFSNLRP